MEAGLLDIDIVAADATEPLSAGRAVRSSFYAA
jgi:hypothetical protein